MKLICLLPSESLTNYEPAIYGYTEGREVIKKNKKNLWGKVGVNAGVAILGGIVGLALYNGGKYIYDKNFKKLGLKPISKLPKILLGEKVTSDLKAVLITNESLGNDFKINESFDLLETAKLSNETIEAVLGNSARSQIIFIEKNDFIKLLQIENQNIECGNYISDPENPANIVPFPSQENIGVHWKRAKSEIEDFLGCLGVKSYVLKRIDTVDATAEGSIAGKGSVSGHFDYSDKSLNSSTEIPIGDSVYDVEQAKVILLTTIASKPELYTILKQRENLNVRNYKLICEFKAGFGISVDILNMVNGETEFEYDCKWSLEVEFHDKNLITKSINGSAFNPELLEVNERKYLNLVKKAYSDLVITSEEETFLISSQKRLKITAAVANDISDYILLNADYSESEKEYIQQLKECYANKVISADEKYLLDELRTQSGIEAKRAQEIEQNILGTIV